MEEKKKDQEKSQPTRDVWIELRTALHRIEGIVRVPSHTPCRRISDMIWHADRGASGILQLADAAVYGLDSNKVLFRKPILGVNKGSVLFVSPMAAESEPSLVWEIPLSEYTRN
ncbi:MAG: hypothetical protein A3G41_08230 [Elusimicrobia bacterium RIFCSPLOWO2_12_FULL_59_9]|nr:MAG: hypothetical protein A3G41_08230 [Elusimicrobia bacterium RIFCSPLOWO2_12_FULL_59_9]